MGERKLYRIRAVCSKCQRLHTSSSRKGLYFTCKHCGHVNAGPGLIEGALKPPAASRRGQPAAAPAPVPTPARSRTVWDTLMGRA
jgi:transposase